MRYDPPLAVKNLLSDAVLDAHLASREARRPAAPVPLRLIEPGQPFVIDSLSGLLFARLRHPSTDQEMVSLVVIAGASAEHACDVLGRVYSLPGTHTARLVDIIRPAMVTPR